MGIYLNPGNEGFQNAIHSEIYVDKTGLIAYTNAVLNTEQKYICVSRPRRFGKSMAANMLAAYYDKGEKSQHLFNGLRIEKCESFKKHLNQYDVIFLNMQEFLGRTHDIGKMQEMLQKLVIRDLITKYPEVDYWDKEDLIGVLQDIYATYRMPMVFIIDEWDCVFREKKEDTAGQKQYLDFLRNLLKDKKYVALCYMTGILPIKKYGSHSALNMFDEFSMVNPRQLAEFTGFTEKEVLFLCDKYQMDFDEMQRWYDGYQFENVKHIYSPRSVVSAMLSRSFDNFWNQTETFEALKNYITLNYEGLKEKIITLLSGARIKVDTGSFSNDMTSFSGADDVLTLLIHLGYLGYDFAAKEVFIPNSEISAEFMRAVKNSNWNEIVSAVVQSERLLNDVWAMNEHKVSDGIAEIHMDTSILTYNDENALACTVSLALYAARQYYHVFRELPAGKGFADMVFLPRRSHLDKPALVVELKWNQSTDNAIAQIEEKRYPYVLKNYNGEVLLVGINYDKKTKQHQCKIKKIML